MVSKKLRIGAASLALYVVVPAVVARAGDKHPPAPEKYTDPEAQQVRDRITGLQATITKIRSNDKLPDDVKQTMIESVQQSISDAESSLRSDNESGKEKMVNRVAGKIYKKQSQILDLTQQKADIQLQWADLIKQGVKLPDEVQEKLDGIDSDINRLQNNISRKKKRLDKRGVSYDSLMPKPSPSPSVEPSAKPSEKPTTTDAEKRKDPNCWEAGAAYPKRIVKYFDLGKSNVSGGTAIRNDGSSVDNDLDQQVRSMKADLKLGDNTRIDHVDVIVHNSKVMIKAKTPEALAKERATNAIDALKKTLNDGSGWVVNFKPQSGIARKDFYAEQADADIGPRYEQGWYEKGINTSVARAKDAKGNLLCPLPVEGGDFDKTCFCTGKAGKDGSLSCDSGPCHNDKLCSRAFALFQHRKESPSPALVVTNGSGGEQPDLQKTMENLETCCSANMSELAYKPHQYVEFVIYPAKFSPNSEACVDPTKVRGGNKKELQPAKDLKDNSQYFQWLKRSGQLKD